jgi:hypothetical protein
VLARVLLELAAVVGAGEQQPVAPGGVADAVVVGVETVRRTRLVSGGRVVEAVNLDVERALDPARRRGAHVGEHVEVAGVAEIDRGHVLGAGRAQRPRRGDLGESRVVVGLALDGQRLRVQHLGLVEDDQPRADVLLARRVAVAARVDVDAERDHLVVEAHLRLIGTDGVPNGTG